MCRALALDPLKLIASGALLIAVAPAGIELVLNAMQAVGIPAAAIGEMRPSGEGVRIVTNGVEEPLTLPERDEIARAFEADGQ